MSRNFNNKPVKKPFCKVCQDAGKPESEYTSHWVRSLPDRSGNTTVTCPTLLSNECRYCFKLGHTAKFCPVLEQNKKDRERTQRKAEAEQKAEQKKKVPVKPLRGFATLMTDSDSEKEEENKVSNVLPAIPVAEEFPALGAPSKTNVTVHLPSVKSGWMSALSKPVPVKQDEFLVELEERSMVKNLPQSALRPAKEVTFSPIHRTDANDHYKAEKDYSKPIYTKSWADWSDSDSEDEKVVAKVVVPPIVLNGPPMPYYNQKAQVMAADYDDEDW